MRTAKATNRLYRAMLIMALLPSSCDRPGPPTDCDYFACTALDTDPPRLLRTVIFDGLVGHENWPSYLPPPLLASVPIRAFVAVTNTCSVALVLVLAAWT